VAVFEVFDGEGDQLDFMVNESASDAREESKSPVNNGFAAVDAAAG